MSFFDFHHQITQAIEQQIDNQHLAVQIEGDDFEISIPQGPIEMRYTIRRMLNQAFDFSFCPQDISYSILASTRQFYLLSPGHKSATATCACAFYTTCSAKASCHSNRRVSITAIGEKIAYD